ncbi:hypothetical protein NW762_010554 [Fusarium torreyae]|uniref:CCHC-type domain-containing protein n=1 Tax=Fusarium torreyae TaxID=1237075 RepID=A0A9W8RTN7_9HYPO|nr:hypothetical protein NW762_010554 [Fusarium torreyae]
MSTQSCEPSVARCESCSCPLGTEFSPPQAEQDPAVNFQTFMLRVWGMLTSINDKLEELECRIPVIPNQPGEDDRASMKFILKTPEDVRSASTTATNLMLEKFRKLGRHWNNITEVRFSDPRSIDPSSTKLPCIILTIKTWESEGEIHKQAGEISRVLNLSTQCYPLPRLYHAHVRGACITPFMKNPKNMATFVKDILPGVAGVTAKVSFNRLLLRTQSHSTAVFLCRMPLYIDKVPHDVVPFCPQGIPVFCHNCWGASHYHEACTIPEVWCGHCSNNHPTKDCPSPDSPKCCNCEKSHPAWDHRCTNKRSKREHDTSAYYRTAKPYWADAVYDGPSEIERRADQETTDAVSQGSQNHQQNHTKGSVGGPSKSQDSTAGQRQTVSGAGAVKGEENTKKRRGRKPKHQVPATPDASQATLYDSWGKGPVLKQAALKSGDTHGHAPAATDEDTHMISVEETSSRENAELLTKTAEGQTEMPKEPSPPTESVEDQDTPMNVGEDNRGVVDELRPTTPSPSSNKAKKRGNRNRNKRKNKKNGKGKATAVDGQTKEAGGAQDAIAMQKEAIESQTPSTQPSGTHSADNDITNPKDITIKTQTETSEGGKARDVTKPLQGERAVSSGSESAKNKNRRRSGKSSRNGSRETRKRMRISAAGGASQEAPGPVSQGEAAIVERTQEDPPVTPSPLWHHDVDLQDLQPEPEREKREGSPASIRSSPRKRPRGTWLEE